MENLNKLELEVLERLSPLYPGIKKHLPYLKVINRDNTGVGMYVNFCYSQPISADEKININNASLSTNENIKIKGLKYGLGYEVDITDGEIKFIEFFTYGEYWNGSINKFSFYKID